MLDFYVKTRIRFSLRDKRLFEITEVEITRVDCILAIPLPKIKVNNIGTKADRTLDFLRRNSSAGHGIQGAGLVCPEVVMRYKRIGYYINVMLQSACLVINPVTVDSFASLCNCTLVGRASDPMMGPA